MEKLSMCRICLVENVRMFVVSNKNLQDIYETLTTIPLVTEDCRPMLTCYFCYSKLKQCCRFKRKCLEAEEQFAQMLNSCEQKPLIKHGNSGPVGGLEKTPIESISIADGLLEVSESDALEVKVPKVPSVPAVTKTQYEFIEIKVEHQNDGLESEDVDHVPERHSSTDSEDDVPLFRIKTEEIDLEAEQVSRNLREAVNTDRAHVVKKPKLLDQTPSGELQKVIQSDSKIFRPNQIRTPEHEFKTRNIQPEANNDIQTTINNLIDSAVDSNFSRKTDLNVKKNTESVKSNKIRKLGTKEKLFNCDICQRSFSKKANLRMHILGHIGKQPFKCELCPRSFSAKCNLDNHFRKHSGEKPYKCEVCQRCFSEKGNLTKHIRIHKGDKPYKCDICHRSFIQKFHLITHSLLHTGEKPFKCEVCQQSFNRLYNCKQHYRTHTGEKPYKCDICQRSFTHQTSLTIHLRMHTGEKPYKCDHCQRYFTQSSHLKQHYRTHTSEGLM